MVFDVENYEKECKKIRTENAELLELFETDLVGLSEKTIQRHLRNVEFYINTYLLREGALSFKDGTEYIDSYLGDFFIRRCMWSTPGSIKSTAASIKKFYKCMLDHKKLKKINTNYCVRQSKRIWSSGDLIVRCIMIRGQ